jgi:hypothetical protein
LALRLFIWGQGRLAGDEPALVAFGGTAKLLRGAAGARAQGAPTRNAHALTTTFVGARDGAAGSLELRMEVEFAMRAARRRTGNQSGQAQSRETSERISR